MCLQLFITGWSKSLDFSPVPDSEQKEQHEFTARTEFYPCCCWVYSFSCDSSKKGLSEIIQRNHLHQSHRERGSVLRGWICIYLSSYCDFNSELLRKETEGGKNRNRLFVWPTRYKLHTKSEKEPLLDSGQSDNFYKHPVHRKLNACHKQLSVLKGHSISCLNILCPSNPNYSVWPRAWEIGIDFFWKVRVLGKSLVISLSLV